MRALAVLLLFVAGVVGAQTVHQGQAITIGWDAVTNFGTPPPVVDSVWYEVYRAQIAAVADPVANPQDPLAHELLGSPGGLVWTWNCGTGISAFGVRTVVNVDSQVAHDYSSIAWSTVVPAAFVFECVTPATPPGEPQSLRVIIVVTP